MSINGTTPPTLPGCSVLPPMEPANVSDGRQGDKSDRRPDDKAKRKPNRRKTADRFVVLNTFIDFTIGRLRRTEIVVWLVLYRDTKGGIACTGQADIARRAGISERTVRRAIGRLKKAGLLTVVRRGGLNKGASTYRVQPLGHENA